MDNHIFPFLWMRGEEESVIRTEMAKIDEANIKSVCLEARPHPDFAGEKWWHDVDIVIDEAKKRNMTIWILDDAHFPTGMANGGMSKNPDKCRRFLYTQFVDVMGPIPKAQVDVDLLTTKQVTWMDFGKPTSKPYIDETKLLSVTASKMLEGDLIDGEPIDITNYVSDGYLTWDVPAGTWRINVSFSTTDIGAKPDYINYIENDSVQVLIDEVYEKHYEHYKEYFGNIIQGFFSDEPGFYNVECFDDANRLGLKMPLPWGKEADSCMKAAYGKNFYRDIPYLYAEEKSGKQVNIRTAYMDVVSKLYSKNFSCKLGDWCRSHGVRYIGHIVEDSNAHMHLGQGVGHYFRAMKGQDIAGIDNIGSQITPGNDNVNRHPGFQDLGGEFFHYQLGKLGGSAAAIDPMKNGRCLCENFGAYGWHLGVRDMKWLVDYLVLQGVNYFVPHAFSMAEYPDADCPPHFYARGNNPQFPYFCKLMKYTDRLCNIFSDGKNVSQAAVLYEAEADWAGNAMKGYKVGKELLTNQIDFTIVPSDVFTDKKYYSCRVDDDVFEINGRTMKCLIVPECEYLPCAAAEFIYANPLLPVFFVGSFPVGISGKTRFDKTKTELLDSIIRNSECVSLDELSAELVRRHIHDEVFPSLRNENLRMYHYEKDGKDIYGLMNVSLADTVDTDLFIPNGTYASYDAMNDKTVKFTVTDGKANITLAPYETIILMSNPSDAAESEPPVTLDKEIEIDTYKLTLCEIGKDEQETIEDFKLVPISSFNRDFSGVMKYDAEFEIDELPTKATFSAKNVFECMTVSVNGKEAGFRITPPYTVDITSTFQKGKNTLHIEIASTALRNANTKPGIFGKERCVIEPTGMFGKTAIKIYK